MAREIRQKLTLGEPASKMITLAKVGQWSCDTGGNLYSLPCLSMHSDVTSHPFKVHSDAPIIPKSMSWPLSSLVWIFQSCCCVRGCAVFLSLIKHLCQNIELLLTEQRALNRSKLMLTAISSHQIYTCTTSETTPEPINPDLDPYHEHHSCQ